MPKQGVTLLRLTGYPCPNMSALDELLRHWRSNPDADATIALCSFLGTSPREALIREVATSAETWHADDGNVMLAVGRMHLDAGLVAEAKFDSRAVVGWSEPQTIWQRSSDETSISEPVFESSGC